MSGLVEEPKTLKTGTSPFSSMMKQWRNLKKRSQLDLALDAGVSQRHVSFLESGRAKPSREMVLSLAEALELPLRERNQLLNGAGYAPVFKERGLDAVEMKSVRHALELTLAHHEPYPAIVADRNWNLQMTNPPAMAFVGILGEPEEVWQRVDPSGNNNLYRMTFHPEGLRPLISNWDDFAKPMLLRLRKEVGADPNNEVLAALLKEITEMAGDDTVSSFSEMTLPLEPVLPMELTVGDMTLKTFTMVSSLGTATDITAEELKVETFFPADDFTEQFFRQMGSSNS